MPPGLRVGKTIGGDFAMLSPMARDSEAIKVTKGWGIDSPANRSAIPDAFRGTGYPSTYSDPGGDTPSRERLNQILCELSSGAAEINAVGIPEWSALLNYERHACVQKGGSLWISQGTTGPKVGLDYSTADPEDSPDAWSAGTDYAIGDRVYLDTAPAAWAAGTDYEVGDYVLSSGDVYRCVRDHTALGGDVADGGPEQDDATGWEAADHAYYRCTRAHTALAGNVADGAPGQANATGWAVTLWPVWKRVERTLAPPLAPPAPMATAGNGVLDWVWDIPDTCGAAITGFTIQWRVTGAGWSEINSAVVTGNSYRLTGLANGTEYEARVKATNGQGDSDWSETGSGTPVATVPGRVSLPTGYFVSHGFILTWVVPDDGGSPITAYQVQWKVQGQPYSSARQATVAGDQTVYQRGLSIGQASHFRVRAVNAVGNGDWSPTVIRSS